MTLYFFSHASDQHIGLLIIIIPLLLPPSSFLLPPSSFRYFFSIGFMYVPFGYLVGTTNGDVLGQKNVTCESLINAGKAGPQINVNPPVQFIHDTCNVTTFNPRNATEYCDLVKVTSSCTST